MVEVPGDDPKVLRAALTAIQDEIVKLMLREGLPEDVQEKLQELESICRHGHDIRPLRGR